MWKFRWVIRRVSDKGTLRGISFGVASGKGRNPESAVRFIMQFGRKSGIGKPYGNGYLVYRDEYLRGALESRNNLIKMGTDGVRDKWGDDYPANRSCKSEQKVIDDPSGTREIFFPSSSPPAPRPDGRIFL